MQLSVIIITRNEEAHIGECLQSVDFADEVVVVDYASTDRTAEIAKAFGARVQVVSDWPGFGPQKNRALAMANGNWVLSLDADERVLPALRDEIKAAVALESGLKGYYLPRRSSYCGQFMRHSGWSPDFVLRLFKRHAARFSDDLVHEKVVLGEATGQLKTPLMHLSFPDFESVLDKLNRYSTAGALVMAQREKRASLFSAIGHGLWAFFRTYVICRGFLDGQLGLALAISNAEGTYYRYAKRWLMTRSRNKVT